MSLVPAFLLPATDEPRRSHVPPMDSTRSLLGLMQLGGMGVAPQIELENPLDGIISRPVMRSLWAAMHARDLSTVRHCRRVAQLSVALAEYLGWEGQQLKTIEVAGLLHDIGKLGVPDNIRFKPGKLTPDEVELMSLHYNVAFNVLQACRVNPVVLEMICNSHATFSGMAPSRMAWRERSLGARILAIADAYESLSTKQPYRPARTHEEIIEILTSGAGKEFDGNVVSAVARYVKRHGLPFAADDAAPLLDSLDRGSSAEDDQLEATWLCQVMSQLYLLESLYDGFFVVDADLRILVWNRGVEGLMGHAVFDMLGRTWTSRLLGYRTPDDQALSEQQCPMHGVLQGSGPQATEMQLMRTDGRAVHVELQTMPMLDEHGRLHGVIEIVRDLTRCQRRVPHAIRELQLAATRDPMTSVANRGELETQLANLIFQQQQRAEEPFSLIFLDADHFKSVNDTYGHGVGDQVLIDLSRLLQQETYSGEIVGRYGGEEFVVLCPATDLDHAIRKAERLRSVIRCAKIGGVDTLRVTASFGVAQYAPGDSIESLLRRADQALYQAKQAGRDRTCSQAFGENIAEEVCPVVVVPKGVDPFSLTSSFAAVIAADIVVYKVGGYVHDLDAEIREVSPDRVVLHLGNSGFFRYWGSRSNTQPVELELHFERPVIGNNAVVRTRVGVTIRPRGWVRDPAVFQARAQQALRELKQYFAAD